MKDRNVVALVTFALFSAEAYAHYVVAKNEGKNYHTQFSGSRGVFSIKRYNSRKSKKIIMKQDEEEKKVNGVHPNLYKTFLILAMVSFSLGALVNYYTLKRLTKK